MKKTDDGVEDYRHDEKRKLIPEAGLSEYEKQPITGKKKYSYDPHLDPQLEWSGKRERKEFDVDTVSLHIHERISSKAIIDGLKKDSSTQLTLFADPQLPLHERIEFYQHDVGWSNRLILGDSLLIENSLLERERMGGRVQMIYIDPPYGIKYKANFQPKITQRDVKEDEKSLTREVEQIRAYRDTWQLGIHSYLTWLRDTIFLCRELLHESGSIFVQISDENLHLVRSILDELFGRENFVAVISFRKFGIRAATLLDSIADYVIWYARDKEKVKYRQLFLPAEDNAKHIERVSRVELPDGRRRRVTREERNNPSILPKGSHLFEAVRLYRLGGSGEGPFSYTFEGKTYKPSDDFHWATGIQGLERLRVAGRLAAYPGDVRYVRHVTDFPYIRVTTIWDDTWGEEDRTYVVQTASKVIERCLLMTTDPGDLVFDPTCGSGTTAYCAEKWGRRWITCDTSRIALFLARQRLMTATFPYYDLENPEIGLKGGFVPNVVPHITMESVAKNSQLDPDKIAKLREDLKASNPQLGSEELESKVRGRIEEIILAGAIPERLHDRPHINETIVRVSGPFTVEAIPVPIAVEPEQAMEASTARTEGRFDNPAADYVDQIIELLRKDGLTLSGSRKVKLENLLQLKTSSVLHAEAQIKQNGEPLKAAISLGPQYGPVTVMQVEDAIDAARWDYSLLIFAGFSFDPEAQAFIQKSPHPKLKLQFAHIRPDIVMRDLLKTTPGSQLFTVFGEPDARVEGQKDGGFRVKLFGMDTYDPVTGDVRSSGPEEIAAWFLDTDYDGYVFHIRQAYFPKEATDRNPWDKLERALRGVVNPEAIEQLRTTVSIPFKRGDHNRVAVKVIDLYGNEIIRILKLA